MVTNGSFSLPAEQGLHSGSEYRVRIKGFRKTGRKYPAADPSVAFDEVEQYLPEKYNAKSQLMAKFSADEQENVFSFELVSNK